ncbi:MAG: GerMN domain-containing protein [Candidatus Buchananbacteria bacterium]|jgi:hypothetical protein
MTEEEKLDLAENETTPRQEQIPLAEPEEDVIETVNEYTEIEPAVAEEVAVESTPDEAPVETALEAVDEVKVDEVKIEDLVIEEVPQEILESAAVEEIPAEEIKEEKAEDKTKNNKEKMPANKIIGIIIVLIVILVVVFYATRKPAAETADENKQSITVSSSLEQGKVSIIEETKNDIKVLVSNGDETAYSKTKVTVYLGNTQKNPNSADCSLAYPLEREIDKKYDSNMINTMIGLLEPLSTGEKEKGYVAVIPAVTTLKYLKLDDSGVMSVNLSGNISKAAGSCAVTAIKSQIKETISQFAAVKAVVICIDGNCNESEILQP